MSRPGEFLIAAGATVAAIIGAVTLFISDLPTWKIGLLLFILVVAFLAGLGLAMWAAGRTREPAHAPTIVDDWRELADYRPPQALPAPARIVNVPAYRTNGQAQPFNMPAQPIPILRTVSDDADLQVPLNYLERFLGLPTPARSEWSGKREMYSTCLAFAEAHGLLSRDARGGAKWAAPYPIEARRRWAAQFEHPVTGDG